MNLSSSSSSSSSAISAASAASLQAAPGGLAISTKWYEVRDTARHILAERYAPLMAELGGVVSKVAAQRRCDRLLAAQEIVRAADLQGLDAIQVLAAAVELEAPSVN